MNARYAIHPSVGIARVGNSPDFYLAPITPGGLPIECDADGTMQRRDDGQPVFVNTFKKDKQIRRQAARFSVYRHDDEAGTTDEVTLDDDEIASITWTVHVANKKGCWYNFRGNAGDLTIPNNTYEDRKVPPRNGDVKDRKTLIVDPGPRTLTGRAQHEELSSAGAPNGYPVSFPPPAKYGTSVTSLGEVRTDRAGCLIVVGGSAASGGPGHLDDAFHGFGNPPPGGSTVEPKGWHDDLGDGPVVCTVTFKDRRKPKVLRAWCIVGPPKFAPELVNAVTLDDVMFDVAVKHFGVLPRSANAASDPLVVNFERDIAPIVARASDVMWVASVPANAAVASPRFDLRDKSTSNRRNRERYARRFRRNATRFFDPNGVPLLPIQAGSDEVQGPNGMFLTLTDTQLRMLRQWARGRFVITPPQPLPGVDPLDRASVANCVGGPLDPGIEVTWSLRDPAIYTAPWRIKHRHSPKYYLKRGLSPGENEQDRKGCEPGDLTKRLATPWQLDAQKCEHVNVSLSDGRLSSVRTPPQYQVAWWPVQRPWQVTHGLNNDPSPTIAPGQVIYWALGASGSPDKFLDRWTNLGFIVNENRVDGGEYPNFVEAERNVHEAETALDSSFTVILEVKPS